MRTYELVYILDPSLEEAQLTALVERFQTLLQSQGAEVQHVERWERRRLAYEIKGRREGLYVVVNFVGSPAAEAEVGRVLGITDGVLRHLITRMDERRAQKAINEAKTAAEARARAQADARAAAEAQQAAAAEEAARLEAAAAAAAAAPAPPPAAEVAAATATPASPEPSETGEPVAPPAPAVAPDETGTVE